MILPQIERFSSCRQNLGMSFLASRLRNSKFHDRIAGYFFSSLLEIVSEELEKVSGKIRVICNSDLHPLDIQTAKAARMVLWKSWTVSQPEALLDSPDSLRACERFRRLYDLLCSGKLEVRVLPYEVFSLINGKAGVITLADGSKTCFMGSANVFKSVRRRSPTFGGYKKYFRNV